MEQFNNNDLFENDHNDGVASEVKNSFTKSKIERDYKVVEITVGDMQFRRYSPADLIAQYYQQA